MLLLSLKSGRQKLHEWMFFFLLFLISTYSLGNDHELSWSLKGHPLRSKEAGGKGTITARRLSSSPKGEANGDYRNPMRWLDGINEHEFEQTVGDGEGQGSLTCCSPWGCKELDTTEQFNNNSCQWTGPLNRRESQKPLMIGQASCSSGPPLLKHGQTQL